MSKILIAGSAIFFILLLSNFSESCKLLSFKQGSGKADFYEKLEGKQCNGQPIYKMLDDVFFMYKLADSNLWCDTYLPSKLVVCQAECDEVRFDFPRVYSQQGAIPQEYNDEFSEWVSLANQAIFCQDFKEAREDIFVVNSTIDQLKNNLKLNDKKLIKTESNEILLDKINQKLKQIQNQTVQESLKTKNQNEIEKTTIKIKSLDTNETTSENLQTSFEKTWSKEDEQVLSMLFSVQEEQRLKKIKNQILENRLNNINQIESNDASNPVSNDFSYQLQSQFIKFGKKSEILSNRENSCAKIDLELSDKDYSEIVLSFELVQDVECFGNPIFKSENEIYLYRNVFGEFCQSDMGDFKSNVDCYRKCSTVLLGPLGIKTPMESNVVTIFFTENNNFFQSDFSNHRYICTEYLDCKQNGCQNEGKCVMSIDARNIGHKCVCPSYATGKFCEKILDICYSNPCLNNATCSSKPFDTEPTCHCSPGFRGKLCENKLNPCKMNPCLNGGICINQISESNIVECSCLDGFLGPYCATPAFKDCEKKPYGQILDHPKNKKLFLICTSNGFYHVRNCPSGLVFNKYYERCDYTDEAPKLENPCNENKCLNGAECIEKSQTSFECACKPGFKGEMCETNIDNCLDNKCGPNGKCVDLVNGYVCLCENNKYGSDCDQNVEKIPCMTGANLNVSRHFYPFDSAVIVQCNENGLLQLSRCSEPLFWNPNKATCSYEKIESRIILDECSEIQCQNGGACILDEEDRPHCACVQGFTGAFCETNVDDCASNPCLNNGTCVDGINNYYCLCQDKFIDKTCCCTASGNPCENVLNDINFKIDKTLRFAHPFSKEKFLVCNLQGYAQVLECPEGLIWIENEQSCGLKSDYILNIYYQMCMSPGNKKRFSYAYSKLKYVECNPKGYNIKDCPIKTPYFCEKFSVCVSNLNTDCRKKY